MIRHTPYEFIKEKWAEMDKKYVITFFISVGFGLIVHSYALFNKINFHDDIASLFGVGTTVASGRWGLEIFFLFNAIFLNLNCSMPVINGVCSILFIALSACFVVAILNIKNSISTALVGMVMVSFPVVASTFSFMFTAPYYFLALLLAIFAVYCIEKNKIGIAAVAIGFSISLYQPYLMVFTTLALIVLTKAILENCSIQFLVKKIFFYACSLALGVVVWLGGFWIWKKIYHMGQSAGGRIETTINLKLSQILDGVALAYKDFFSLLYRDYKGLSNGRGAHIFYSLIFVLVIAWTIYIIGKCKLRVINKILFVVMIVLFPLAVGWINILSVTGTIDVHTLTVYSYVFIHLIPIFLMDKIESERLKNSGTMTENCPCLFQWIAIGVVTFGLVYYVRLDNMAYLKTDFIQKQTDSYFTTLVTQIKSVEGYKDDMPIAIIKTSDDSYDLNDKSMFDCSFHNRVTLYSADWNMNKWVTDYAWEEYMNYHCGFAPEVIRDTSELEERNEVKSMPCYPDDGSIKIVDNIIVVNMDSSRND